MAVNPSFLRTSGPLPELYGSAGPLAGRSGLSPLYDHPVDEFVEGGGGASVAASFAGGGLFPALGRIIATAKDVTKCDVKICWQPRFKAVELSYVDNVDERQKNEKRMIDAVRGAIAGTELTFVTFANHGKSEEAKQQPVRIFIFSSLLHPLTGLKLESATPTMESIREIYDSCVVFVEQLYEDITPMVRSALDRHDEEEIKRIKAEIEQRLGFEGSLNGIGTVMASLVNWAGMKYGLGDDEVAHMRHDMRSVICGTAHILTNYWLAIRARERALVCEDPRDLRTLLLHLTDMYQLQAKATGKVIAFVPEWFPDDISVSDLKKARFVLHELMLNAFKYSHHITRVSWDKSTHSIVIENDGYTIPAGVDPFAGGWQGNHGHPDSTGYGLREAERVAREMGLRLTFSSVDNGSPKKNSTKFELSFL